MTIRQWPPLNGKRFIGNNNKNQVHDLEIENTADNGCQIDEIKDEHIVTFTPDTLAEADRMGYKNCDKCIGD